MRIHVEESALGDLSRAFETAGNEYKNNLTRLTSLIEEITKGHIQGDVATEFLNKYMEKQTNFDGVKETIDKAQQYLRSQNTGFVDMITGLKENTK